MAVSGLCSARSVTGAVLDFLRRQRADRHVSFDDVDGEAEAIQPETSLDLDEPPHADGLGDPPSFFMQDAAERVQASVRARVSPRSWEAFWLVAIQGWPVEGTARALEMTHVAVYAARSRVARLLREEGKRASRRGENVG